MATSIGSLLNSAGSKMSDNESFRNVFENHISFFKTAGQHEVIPVTPMQLYVHGFSWLGLLNDLGVEKDMHWFTIRLNGYESFNDTPKDADYLLIPIAARVRAMYATHVSRKGKKK